MIGKANFIPVTDNTDGFGYTLFVACSWHACNLEGVASYILIDKNGNILKNEKWFPRTNSFRLLLLAIWSGLVLVCKKRSVRIVTTNDAVIKTFSEKNINNDTCITLKQHVVEEKLRIGNVCISRPLSATDQSYIELASNNCRKVWKSILIQRTKH